MNFEDWSWWNLAAIAAYGNWDKKQRWPEVGTSVAPMARGLTRLIIINWWICGLVTLLMNVDYLLFLFFFWRGGKGKGTQNTNDRFAWNIGQDWSKSLEVVCWSSWNWLIWNMVFKKKPQHDSRTAHQEREHVSLVTCCCLTFSAKNGHSLMFCITIFLEFLDVCFVMLVLALHPGVLWALLQRPVVGQQSLGLTQKNVTRRVLRGDGFLWFLEGLVIFAFWW